MDKMSKPFRYISLESKDYCFSPLPIRATILLAAFKRLDYLMGESAINGLIEALQTKGIVLKNSSTYYSLIKVEQALISIFAESGTYLLMEHLVTSLRENAKQQKNTRA